MRVDHLAYQRATHVVGFGFALQAAFGTVLLVIGLSMGDSASVIASLWAMISLVVWAGLLIVSNQHRLERLEALETSELMETAGDTALFEDGRGLGARRLRLLYRWILPLMSVAFAAGLVIAGWRIIHFLMSTASGASEAVFRMTDHRGWMVAIELSFAVVSFIFSRYLAGMAQLPAWKNLRAAAGIMVGNSIVFMAIAVGVVFRFFDLTHVVQGVAWGVAIFMFAVAVEVVLAFILNMYRPRVAGEYPRVAFDSRALSLLSRPDSFIRSINEAVNYQFGFDISSSWGYQLVLRSGVWLGGLSIVSLLVMSMFVVVGGRQEGLRLRSGRIIGEGDAAVQRPGAFWKLPWPLEYATLHDVTEIRTVPVTPAEAAVAPAESGKLPYDNWAKPLPLVKGAEDAQFIVRPSEMGETAATQLDKELEAAGLDVTTDGRWSLIRARITLGWRVDTDGAGGESGLLQYLSFGSDRRARRQPLDDRSRILRAIASSEATRLFSTRSLDDILTTGRGELGAALQSAVQDRLDELDSGIEVVSVDLPLVTPPGDVVQSFEDLPVAIQQADRTVANAEREQTNMLTAAVGDPRFVDEVVTAVEAVEAARLAAESASGNDAAAAESALADAVSHAETLVRRGGGAAFQIIADAERDRWVGLLTRLGQATRVRGQEAAWSAAPELFRQRSVMRLYARYLPRMRKYVMGVDPTRLDLNVELRELASPNTVFSDSLMGENEGEE
ncbi:MAG: SPFH domain-containing protein [Phycisphaerales bacterium]|jgi:regulator of protease activity HflC (stomatin/prohibitin superfamily)|nr:SPFH domain-containing protein [Phycisphaerales bacterium]